MSFSCSSVARGSVAVLVASVLLVLTTAPTRAQSGPPSPSNRPSMQRGQTMPGGSSSPSGPRVPSWAESRVPAPSFHSRTPRGPRTNSAPGMPGDDPSNMPVDGGLGWLAAAGAAYTVRRLRKGTTDSEDEDT